MAYVYILRHGRENKFKIGRTTKSVKVRLKELSTCNPDLAIFDIIETEHETTIEKNTSTAGWRPTRSSMDRRPTNSMRRRRLILFRLSTKPASTIPIVYRRLRKPKTWTPKSPTGR